MQLFINIFVQCYAACPSINILGFDDFLQLTKGDGSSLFGRTLMIEYFKLIVYLKQLLFFDFLLLF